jgi:hypothetical protein
MNPNISFENRFRSKLWEIIPLSFARGIVSNNLLLLDNSANKFHCSALMKFESHYDFN